MWCADNQVDPHNPSSIDIANHLPFMSIYLQLSASSLKVRKTTTSSTLASFGHSGFSSNKIVNNVIKATALRQSKSKVKIPDWDILVLLSFLMTDRFEPLEDLTLKTPFLCMLASGRRALEVCNLSGLLGDVSHEADGSYSLCMGGTFPITAGFLVFNKYNFFCNITLHL